MSIHAHRKGSESNDSLMQRWKKQVQQTGLLKLVRERSHFRRSETRRMERIRALKREEHREENRKRQFYSNM
jgi:ribosomal protein S21